MKVRKTILWSVLSFLTGFAGIVLALAAGGYAVWRTMGGHSLKETVKCVVYKLSFDMTWELFLTMCVAAVGLILISVIFKSIGKAVYRKRLKKAVEKARLANSGQGSLFNLTPEMKEQVTQTAKKLAPVIAIAAVACVVVGAVNKSRARRRREELQMSRYYPY